MSGFITRVTIAWISRGFGTLLLSEILIFLHSSCEQPMEADEISSGSKTKFKGDKDFKWKRIFSFLENLIREWTYVFIYFLSLIRLPLPSAVSLKLLLFMVVDVADYVIFFIHFRTAFCPENVVNKSIYRNSRSAHIIAQNR